MPAGWAARLRPRGGLLDEPAFVRLWAAQAVSAVGTRVTRTALPVLAVLSLDGSPRQVALLAALTYGPGFLVGLLAGGLVDRGRKRDVLVAADLVRAAAVATLPLAAWAGALSVGHVHAVALIVGAATAVFQIADVALLPRLLAQGRLVAANSRLAATESFAELTGPALAGALIQAVGAPLAVLLDAASYVWSASFLGTLRSHEPAPVPSSGGTLSGALRALVRDVEVGTRAAFGHPVVGPLFAATGVAMLCAGFQAALYMLYTLRTLGLSTATVGVVIGVGGVGALGGTLVSRALAARLGAGPTLAFSLGLYQLALLLVPLAGAPGLPRAGAVAFLVLQQLVGDAFFMSFAILATSLRQTAMPEEVLGRVNATLQVVTGLLLPLGALAAGPCADLLGVRGTLWLACGLGFVGPLILAARAAVRRAALPALA